MSELIEWLNKEANRNSQLQGNKAHTSRRRSAFRHRAKMQRKAADEIERLESALREIASDEFDCTDLSAKGIAVEALSPTQEPDKEQT